MTTIGIIYPDHAAEDEYPTAADRLGVRLPVVHIYGTDLHAVPELLDLGSPEKLAEGVGRLLATVAGGSAVAAGAAAHSAETVGAVVWACTSGSFVYGYAGVRQQADQLAEAAGVPAASTSQSFVAAASSLGVRRVAVAASYPEEVAVLFTDFLAASGIDVVARGSAGIDTAAEVGSLESARVMDLALQNDHPAAEALLIPDTAMHTLEVLPAIEARLGKPVFTANQVTIWHGLRLAGSSVVSDRLGALFTRV
ncbi:maleate cis-trans isomerase [Citricoccus sp.]|uniref:maleate cis-trans isomerase family protein n=1 Tax=Citricoccus sp. TaxID=1978372 RepID=UPI0028BE5C26|nr:maleate cis-trans isomerase [Citricoccus sp.]